ncbi:MAG TPA: TonB-dependent receptor, partial [Gemmatimonadales bacterium]
MTGIRWVPLVGLLWAISPLRAQEVTGALEGLVIAGTGETVEGAEIIVEGAVLQGTRGTTTDRRGRFTIRSLPAGAYVVVIRRISYRPVRFEDVPVRLGLTTSLGEVRLETQTVELAEIVVSGARPVIDPVSAATGATLDSSQFRSLPAQRDFRALIAFLPQANASDYGDGANIGGSTGLENAFYIDGMHATTGAGSSIDLPFNFVREIQVRTGGYEAEFGRALSGVVNVVTPTGGNEFRGEALGFFAGDILRTD